MKPIQFAAGCDVQDVRTLESTVSHAAFGGEMQGPDFPSRYGIDLYIGRLLLMDV